MHTSPTAKTWSTDVSRRSLTLINWSCVISIGEPLNNSIHVSLPMATIAKSHGSDSPVSNWTNLTVLFSP